MDRGGKNEYTFIFKISPQKYSHIVTTSLRHRDHLLTMSARRRQDVVTMSAHGAWAMSCRYRRDDVVRRRNDVAVLPGLVFGTQRQGSDISCRSD